MKNKRKRKRNKRSEKRLAHVFERIVELLKELEHNSHLIIGGRLGRGPEEKKYVDTMLKRKYIESYDWDGVTYYYLTDTGRKVLENVKKESEV